MKTSKENIGRTVCFLTNVRHVLLKKTVFMLSTPDSEGRLCNDYFQKGYVTLKRGLESDLLQIDVG